MPDNLLLIQERVGYQGKMFRMYKIRTMKNGGPPNGISYSDTHVLGKNGKLDHDPRVTRIGRYLRRHWVDEFPQIINMMRGEMKLFGTRPLTPETFHRLPEDLKTERIKYKPGIFSQLYADDVQSWNDRIESERRYLAKKAGRPFWTDVKYFSRFVRRYVTGQARGS